MRYLQLNFLDFSIFWDFIFTVQDQDIMSSIKRVAVIGAGPAGAIAVDALAQEGAFDVIRVFERREKVGGCWYVGD